MPPPAIVARRADALEVVGVARVTHPPDQQRDVGALAAAVGVQLVEDEEPQALRGRASERLRSSGRVRISSSIT